AGKAQAADAQVLSSDGRVLDATPALHGVAALLAPSLIAQEGHHPRAHLLNLTDPDIDIGVMGAPVRLREGTGVVLVGVETQGFVSARHDVISLLVIGLACTTVLVGLITWILTGRALRVVS